MAGTAGVGEEVRADRLNASLDSTREGADGLEVFVSSPALGERREREGESRHCNAESTTTLC